MKSVNFEVVAQFEEKIATFFGAKYGIAIDSCTHGIELCLIHQNVKQISVPKNTYLSIPFLANKLNIQLQWRNEAWKDYYTVHSSSTSIIDAAVLWRKNSYIPGTFMSLSFQYQKHLRLGRGGMILCDDKEAALELKKMS